MPKYKVFGFIDACTRVVEIEADSAAEAEEKFYDMDEARPSVCHQCAREIEFDEVYKTEVKLVEE